MMDPVGTLKTGAQQTSGGEPTPPSEENEARETRWVVLIYDHERELWDERQDRITAPTRAKAERDALTISDSCAVAVVPARSWAPVTEERPTEIRVVPFDPWAGA